jgi:hypothetical protein
MIDSIFQKDWFDKKPTEDDMFFVFTLLVGKPDCTESRASKEGFVYKRKRHESVARIGSVDQFG